MGKNLASHVKKTDKSSVRLPKKIGYIIKGEAGPEMKLSNGKEYFQQNKHCLHVFCQPSDQDKCVSVLGKKELSEEELVYHKGDIYIAELGENFGHEQSGTRPVIIMQNDVGNYFSPTVTIVPLTSKDKKPGQPTHYRLDMKKYPFLTSSSTALCESPRTLDKRLLKRYLGSIDREDLEKVDEALAVHIGYRIPDAVDAP